MSHLQLWYAPTNFFLPKEQLETNDIKYFIQQNIAYKSIEILPIIKLTDVDVVMDRCFPFISPE